MEFLVSFFGSGVGAALVGFLGKDWLAARLKAEIEKEMISRRSAYELKVEACLEALSVVDAHFSNIEWDTPEGKLKPEPQMLGIEEARRCYNKLSLTCEDPTVVECYANTLGLRAAGDPVKEIRPDAIVDLRNAMRLELGFGKKLAFSREKAWIAQLGKPVVVSNSLDSILDSPIKDETD